MTAPITDVATLEAVVGQRSEAAMLKSIALLDEHCAALLAASPLAVLGTPDADRAVRSVLLGGAPGHLAVSSPTELAVTGLVADGLVDGAPAGLLAFVPGYRETLRVNGALRLDGSPRLEVEEAFLHCAKAIIRSKLWDPATSSALTGGSSWTDVLAAAPLVSLASVDAAGKADVSPKGDPAGFVQVLDDATLAIPDRPGNKRTDTLHNLVDQPDLGVLALVPGSSVVLELRGTATITDRESVVSRLEVNGRRPAAAIVLTVDDADVRDDPAMRAARPWDADRRVDPATLPKSACIWVDHVKMNEDREMVARLGEGFTPENMELGLAYDYEHNLY